MMLDVAPCVWLTSLRHNMCVDVTVKESDRQQQEADTRVMLDAAADGSCFVNCK